MIEERLGRAAPGGTAAISLDSTVLVVVGLAGVLIAGALSLVPLLAPWQRRLAGILQGDGRSATDVRSARWARSALVAAEVALSIALLAGSGLMIRTVVNLMQTDLGFATTDVRRARIALPPRSYPDAPAFLTIYDRFIERMRAMSDGPFTVTSFIPFWEAPKQGIEIQGQRVDGLTVGVTAATEGYFATFGIDILQGRGLTAVDRAGSEPVAVVSQSLARRFWPNGDAIGQRIRTAEEQVAGSPLTVWRTIVGVVADARQTYPDSDLEDVYISFLQAPNRFARVFVRTERSQPEWIDMLRRAGTEFDPDVLVTAGTPLATEAERELAGPRFLMSLLTGFAAFAGLLAILGVYSVTACVVQQREREVAIRIALGATSRGIVLMFLRQGGAVLSLGIGLGLLGAAGVARTLESQLHGVRPFDGATFVAACLVIAGGGLAAVWWPSRRAATAPPIVALKEG
jgi:predicted permease